MNQVKWPFLIYAILITAGIMGIGIEIAEKSLLGILISILAVIIIIGMGFRTKKKMREKGLL